VNVSLLGADTEVRVRFDLEVDDGFPPISAEVLIGKLESIGHVRLDNTPFFATGVAFGDIVRCIGCPPNLIFASIAFESGYRAISVIFIDNSYQEELFQSLKVLGCYVEFGEFPEYDMIAVAIPPDLNYDEIKQKLDKLETEGKISFAELCL